MRTALVLACFASIVCVGACETAPRTSAERDVLAAEVTSTLTRFRAADPTLQELLDKAVGWAVFPDVGKAGLGVGGAYGKGELFEGGRKVGFCDVTQGTVGLQIGAQTFSELVVFMRQGDLDAFKGEVYEFAANVSAIAIKEGAARSVDYSKGVVVFTIAKGGLMAEASVGGQRFSFRPLH